MFCSNINGLGSKIDVMNADLTSSHSFGEKGFGYSCCIAMDTKCMVYVSVSAQGVLKFTPEGEFLYVIGTEEVWEAELSNPVGICIDANDILYVCDLGDHSIKAYTTEGQYLGKFRRRDSIAPDPKGIAVDDVGNIYVCDDSCSGAVLVSRPY